MLNFYKFAKVAFSKKFLLTTNVAISTVLSGVGDVIEQGVEYVRGDLLEWDKLRTENMALSGITVGIVTHHWYSVLETALPGNNYKRVVKKVVADTVIASPVMIATFFVTMAILERQSYNDFIKEFQQKWWRLYIAEITIWPVAQFVNFYFLPLRYRVLYDSGVSLIYDIYTSYVKNFLVVESEPDT